LPKVYTESNALSQCAQILADAKPRWKRVAESREPQVREDYRERLRAAVLQAASQLNGHSIENTIPSILASMGETLDVDRVSVLENGREKNQVNVCYAWQCAGVLQVKREVFEEYPSTSAQLWERLAPLAQGNHVSFQRSTASGAVAHLLDMIESQSVLIIPVVIGEETWGVFAVDSCRQPRDWAPVEIDLLKMLANFLGASIIRDRYLGLLRASEEKFRTVAEAALDGMVVIDSKGIIQYWNPAAERILGYTSKEAIGSSIHARMAPERYQATATAALGRFHNLGGGPIVGSTRECAALRKDGVEIPIELSVSPMRIQEGWSAIGIVRDISARKEAQQRIMWLARHDSLTGLANRSVFVDEIEQALARYRRSGERFAVFYLDIDHFKEVNDTLGHPAGDLLLKQVSGRLRSTIRDIDTVARFGGDEFAILATDLTRPTDAGILASKLVEAMARPFAIEGTQLHTGASIGIASCDHDHGDAEALLAHADAALYRAKSEERGTFRFFTHRLHDDVRQRVDLLVDLRRAIEQREFTLLYQPQVDMLAGNIIGVEALIRWQHPARGLLPPSEFMTAAENSGLTIPLGRFVLFEACRQTRRWLDSGLKVPLIAVNVSPLQFKAPTRFSTEINQALKEFWLDPSVLEIELTETALMYVSRDNSKCLSHMRDQGIRLAVDDFGTGYSCFDYLRHFPVSRLKIAQSFVDEITSNSSSAAVTRATINLGRELGVGLIAEGVESAEQASLLTKWGCRAGQGFYFSAALNVEQITPLLRDGKICVAQQQRPTEKVDANLALASLAC
jgi:diguanylate cyclase (GGDEF)-like protein/PAS domain S-box-containing protein